MRIALVGLIDQIDEVLDNFEGGSRPHTVARVFTRTLAAHADAARELQEPGGADELPSNSVGSVGYRAFVSPRRIVALPPSLRAALGW
jgi:hypothetical protein